MVWIKKIRKRICVSLSFSNDSPGKRQGFRNRKSPRAGASSGDVPSRRFRFLHHGLAFAGTGDAVIDLAEVPHRYDFFFVRGVGELTGGGVDRREGGPDTPATGKLHEERVRTRLFRRGEEDEEEGRTFNFVIGFFDRFFIFNLGNFMSRSGLIDPVWTIK